MAQRIMMSEKSQSPKVLTSVRECTDLQLHLQITDMCIGVCMLNQGDPNQVCEHITVGFQVLRV